MAGGGLETALNGSRLTEEEVAKELVPELWLAVWLEEDR
jgi:hypothetical protein